MQVIQQGSKDIVTIDLKKSTVIKVFVLKPVSSKMVLTEQKAIALFPNPAFDLLNISSSVPIIKASVYNLAGQLMLLETGPVQQLDISGLKTGWYVIEVTTQQGTYIKKIRKVGR